MMTVFSIMLDLLPILLIVLGAIFGMRQGFIRVVFGRLRRLTSLALAAILARPVGSWVKDEFLLAPVTGKIKEFLADALGAELSGATGEEMASNLPAALRGVLNLLRIDISEAAADAEAAGGNLLEQFASRIAEPAARFLGVLLAFVALYFLCRIFLRLLVSVVDMIFKLPGLRILNSLLGLVFGLLFAVLYSWLLVTALGYVGDLLANGDVRFFAGFDIEKTYIAKYFYSFRPIEFIFSIK
jgi:uncharacterized membrane protein required for colicin V production